jgi:hypothetical protein
MVGFLAAALLGAAGPAAPAQPADGGPATLAVLPLRGTFNVPRSGTPDPRGNSPAAGPRPSLALEDQINQRVTMAMLRTGRFRLVERSQLTAVLKEGRFEQSGLVDDATAARLGQQIGATFVLVGSYTGGIGHTTTVKTGFFGGQSREESYPGHLEVRLRLVGTEDGAIREAMLLHAASKDAAYYHSYELLLDDLGRSLDQDLAVRFPLTGYVIKLISSREALVDLGRRQGLEPGDRFNLAEQEPDVVHPVTGKRVQGERRILSELKVVEVGEESSLVQLTGPRVTLKPGQVVVRLP